MSIDDAAQPARLPRQVNPDELPMALETAERYFLRQESKTEIASALGVSRFKVARWLTQCLDEGIVRITIRSPEAPRSELADLLRARYDLDHVVVVTVRPDGREQGMRTQLGEAAADLLMRIATEQDIIGVGWGRTVKAMADAVTALPGCPVVQMGGMVGSPGENSMELVRRLAAVSRGPAFPLYAPLLVSDVATARGLRKQAGIAQTLARYDDITIGIVAVGSWNPPNSQLRTAFSLAEQAHLATLGVRAEVCGFFLNDDGDTVAQDVAQRTVAIGAEQLRRIPTVIAVAGGLSKVRAIHSVLVGRYATSIITDSAVAQALVENR